MKKKKLGYLQYILLHPIEGFEEFNYYKSGSLPLAMGILAAWFLIKIIERQATGFIHNSNNPESLNVLYIFMQTVVLFTLWCVSNWAFCTLMDGKGTFKYIWISCSYALVPMIAFMLIATVVSNFLTYDEAIFRVLLIVLGDTWSIWLLVSALRTIHDYTFGKTIVSIMLTLFGIACILFILVLSLNLYKQVFDLFRSIFSEIQLRL